MKNPVDTFNRRVKTPIVLILFGAFTFSQPTFSCATIGASAWLEDVTVDQIIHVNQNHLQSSDLNPGSKDLPLNTIKAGANLAMRNHKRGFSTKVLIYPGVYREQIKMYFNKQKNDPPIIFEAKEKGTATISGSNVLTGWKETNSPNIYVHHWPYKWGLSQYPSSWKENNITLLPIVRRREMVIVNSALFEQVLSFAELDMSKFYVSENEKQIYIHLPHDTSLVGQEIEVAVFDSLLNFKGKTNVIVRGLRFQYAASGVQGAAVSFADVNNVLMEDCVFVWNNWSGVNLHNLRNVTSRRNVANFNGGTGITGFAIKDLLSIDDETSYNNLRGAKGNFYYWAVSGAKYMRLRHAVFRGHVAKGNHAGGFWLDYDNEDVLVVDSLWCGNLKHGLFIEASQGPISVRNTTILGNMEWGIRAMDSSKVLIENNHILKNRGPQLRFHGSKERSVENWDTGKTMAIKMEHWSLRNNVINGHNLLLETVEWDHFLRSLTSEGNLWYKQLNTNGFKVGKKRMNFSEWKTFTGKDFNSTFAKLEPETQNRGLEDCAYTSD